MIANVIPNYGEVHSGENMYNIPNYRNEVLHIRKSTLIILIGYLLHYFVILPWRKIILIGTVAGDKWNDYGSVSSYLKACAET